MNRNKISIIFASIGIILVSMFMILCSYAYFTVDLRQETEDIEIKTFNENTTIIYNDTSNVSMVNAYTGDEIVKTFSIENTSSYPLYYDIVLKNVVNNFENKKDLVYEISSTNNGANKTRSIIPSEEENIATNILIKPSQKQLYEVKITFLDTDFDQSINMGKTFSSNIAIVPSKGINVGEHIYQKDTLLEKMVTSAIKYDVEREDEGIFYSNSSTYGYPIYFYRGSNNLNNNLLINNDCYKILRTDENYGIRVVYSGKYEDGTCTNTQLSLSEFNTKSNYNAYIGYMYGDASSNNYKIEHNNISSSTIKINLDKWFNNELNNTTYISNDPVFCNNRVTKSFKHNGVLYSDLGYSNNNTGYISYNNDYYTYECYNKNDRFSYKNVIGNTALNHPVGLITYDEIMFASISDVKTSFLETDYSYWTMTPAYFNGSDAYNYAVVDNKLIEKKVTNEFGIRPVISLNKDVKIVGGEGTITSPYKVR